MAILAIRSSSVTCVTFHAFLFCFTVLAKQYLPGVFMQLRKLLFAVLLVLSALPCLATHMAVVVDKSNGANTHQHYEDAFEEFQCGYGPQYAPLIAMGVSRLSVLAHER